MLGKRYITISGSRIPNPTSFDYGYDRQESRYTTESGNEVVFINGIGKFRASMQFQATSWLKRRLEALYLAADTVPVGVDGTTYSDVFIESFQAELVSGSESTPNTQGLWNVSLDLKQL